MLYRAYAAKQPKSQLEQFEYSPGDLGPEEVEIAVTHCGICHTDAAMVDNDWGATRYPFVPGHEISGTVSQVGSQVNLERLRVGQRVAMGAICGSCQSCEWCEAGKQNVCAQRVDTVLRGHQGGFASHVRAANWHFVYPLPDAISSEHAGPLLCAGTTVFTPLLRNNVSPTDRVAVVGIGGLGHLALQYFSKWGCDVTAISSSHDKDEQARELGARHVIASRGSDELAKAASSFDFILSTVSGDLPWDHRSRRCACSTSRRGTASRPESRCFRCPRQTARRAHPPGSRALSHRARRLTASLSEVNPTRVPPSGVMSVTIPRSALAPCVPAALPALSPCWAATARLRARSAVIKARPTPRQLGGLRRLARGTRRGLRQRIVTRRVRPPARAS
jgi:alcohol/geraniol dehydrogenase (NADP+)